MDKIMDRTIKDLLQDEVLEQLAVNVIRGLSMDAVQKANSGHPGTPMGLADAAVVLWTRFLSFDPEAPDWPDRDRFVLSCGHASMLLYSLLFLSGYGLTLEDLKNFRQFGSKTAGHPEYGHTPGVETTTGPLGQGISNAVGMALAERILASRYNKADIELFNHWTYVFASDGDLMEGISHESCSLAGHLGLGKLIVLYDDNGITIDGHTSLAYSDNVQERFLGYGWEVQQINGNDRKQVEAAFLRAKMSMDKPHLIIAKTHIGYGSPHKQDSEKAHGEPLGEEEVRLAKERLGLPPNVSFYVPEEVKEYFRVFAQKGKQRRKQWLELYESYSKKYPKEALELEKALKNELPEGWDKDLPTFPLDKPIATRAASGSVINAIFSKVDSLIGGSADLTPSNNTKPKEAKDITKGNYAGRYIHYGVREHGMAAIMSGMALHKGIRPYGGTFLIFSDYMRPTMRLAAMMKLPVIYIFTHDSIGLGEDGPTHQPVEQLTALRAIPNMTVFRPCDAAETVEGWKVALEKTDGPTALILTRQALPVLDRSKYASSSGARYGAYVLSDMADFQVILIGTGSEVHIALEAQKLLAQKQIPTRVVSMPSWDLFLQQPAQYIEEVIPSRIRARVAVEAGATLAWNKWIGLDGEVVGLDHFGASAPYKVIYQQFGITAEKVMEAAIRSLGKLQ
ncbi:transketolase [Candidatus Methylacidiphilum fumarolicum]|uniref:Transketolase n=2 Tax=Candidatus Methylacidiphilum fumarolicum TaxID=591154 RepID=I0JYX0_METFB|nr:transketolase [Candidatus Methylacidiphilum fumarolicum]AEH40987.1 transketolase [Methylacidiphilum fumariolicum SolV]TFE71506.1 transketolase [Candidatus Methylacidiphilum fumarolicum]TFE71594.1 transketolase [Candidatus Methylacidiphilum fumarolicum]CAI9085834.1 transketolase 2 [Candidatus Methylacidiphilum fumarolicum]CCG92439.1 Transketolase [Methylacidiphilum fumariolicum SolV]